MLSETCSRDPREDVWSSGGGEGTKDTAGLMTSEGESG